LIICYHFFGGACFSIYSIIHKEYVAWETWLHYTGIEKVWWQSKQANGRGGAVGWSQPARSITSGIKQSEEGDLRK
jgi:hypothetical protein